MANEIEIVSTKKQGIITVGHLINEFDRINQDEFDGFFNCSKIKGIKVGGSYLNENETIITRGLIGYLTGELEENIFGIEGPRNNLFKFDYTAQDLLDDNRHFSDNLLKKLIVKVSESDTSYKVIWISGGDKVKNSFAYALSLSIANLLNGVIINNYGTSLPEGTYLADSWVNLLKKEITG